MQPRPRPLLQRCVTERIANDGVTVAVPTDLVVPEGADSGAVAYANYRVIGDRGTAEHHGASRTMRDAKGVVANLIVVEGHRDTAERRPCINTSGLDVIA